MKKRNLVVIICIVLVICLVGGVTGASLAIWKEVKSKDLAIEPTPDINPSLRSQIFAPLDIMGVLIDFEEYDVTKHGALQYSSVTSIGYTLYYYGQDGYDVATSYVIASYLNPNEQVEPENPDEDDVEDQDFSLYVRTGTEDYDESIHGERQYELTDKNGNPIYYHASSSSNYERVEELLFSNSQMLENLYVVDYENSKEFTIYLHISKDDLVPSTKTTTGNPLLYFDTDSIVPASPEQVLAGENLRVYLYTAYDKDNDEMTEQYGEIVLSSKTNKGAYLYSKEGNDYITKIPASLDDTDNVYVGSEINSYALVGYTGTVAELVVPSIYTDASGRDFRVTKICSSNDYKDASLTNNKIITSISIPATIESIADGTFANLANLKTVYFTGAGTIRLGFYCFMGCGKLEKVYTGDGARLVDPTGRSVAASKDDMVFSGCNSLN